MKRIIFIACLFTGLFAKAQIRAGSNRINKGVTVSNTQPAGNINQTTVQSPTSGFSKMKLKLPFSTIEKEYMVEKVGHFYVLNGDIIVGNDFQSTLPVSHEDNNYRWPGGNIPYVIDPSIYDKKLHYMVFDVISKFNRNTKICLGPRHNDQKDYVRIIFSNTIKEDGLSSVGRQGGEQPLYLAASATTETVLHQLMHAAGFYHEQCREDRDQFVRINKTNIRHDAKNYFQIEGGVAINAYDFCSIMHCKASAFSINGQPAIECLNGIVPPCPSCMDERKNYFSESDIKRIDLVYSDANNSRCSDPKPKEPGLAGYYPSPYEFPKINLSASQAAMEAFRHRTDVAFKERHVSEFIKIVGAYPNFHEARLGNNTVGGTVFLYSAAAQWQDVPLAALGNTPMDDFAARMRATQVYAVQNGFIGGFPTFYHADYGKGIVCGTVLIEPGAAEWREVLLTELGNPALDNIGARMRSANDYALRNGYLGGFPTFYHADYDGYEYGDERIVCGIVLIKKEAGEWRDVITVVGAR